MDDLISRAAAIEALGERPYNWTDSDAEISEVSAWESHKEAIERVSAVDAVPVVRCKDCKHSYFASNRAPDERCWMCGKHGIEITTDWFCADGERRESE